jgi:hypothetical protein
MQRRAIQRQRSLGEVVHAIDQSIERRAAAEGLDRAREALGIADAHARKGTPAAPRGRLTCGTSCRCDDAACRKAESAAMRPDRAVTVVLAAGVLGLAAQHLFVRERAGLNVIVAAVLFLAAA